MNNNKPIPASIRLERIAARAIRNIIAEKGCCEEYEKLMADGFTKLAEALAELNAKWQEVNQQ